MHEAPDAADLLATARAALLEELLPALPEPLRLTARMAANAIAIAARMAASAEKTAPDHALEGVLLLADASLRPATLARLCKTIREGRLDPGTVGHEAARDYLAALVARRCAVSNPKAQGPGRST